MSTRISSTDPRHRARGDVGYSPAPSFDFVPPLDGLRAVSIGLVLAGHFGGAKFAPAAFGVTIFFFISGFLITRQLLAEQQRAGAISLSKFYARRMLRLYPALLVSVLVGALAYAAIGGTLLARDVLSALFYAANYNEIYGGFASNLPDNMHPFRVLWSLAVEEHYYFAFPILVVLLGARRLRFAIVLSVLVIAVTLWRFQVAAACSAHGCLGDPVFLRSLHGTDTRIDSILYGAVFAALLGSPAADAILAIVRTRAALLAGIALILLSLLYRDALFRNTMRYTVQGLGLTLAIGAILFDPRQGWARALLSSKPAQLLGRWSYSIYLWHAIILMIGVALLPESLRAAEQHGGLSLAQWLTIEPPLLLITIAVAAASYGGIERPLLRLRRRFGAHPAADAEAPPAAAPLSAASEPG